MEVLGADLGALFGQEVAECGGEKLAQAPGGLLTPGEQATVSGFQVRGSPDRRAGEQDP